MALIDIGSAAIDRSDDDSGWTDVNKGNPANASGIINSIQIF